MCDERNYAFADRCECSRGGRGAERGEESQGSSGLSATTTSPSIWPSQREENKRREGRTEESEYQWTSGNTTTFRTIIIFVTHHPTNVKTLTNSGIPTLMPTVTKQIPNRT